MPPKDAGPTAVSLSEQFARLPVELLIEIASCLGQLTEEYSISDGPRTAQASAFLLALMSQSHHLRQAARPMYWSEVHVSSKSRVSGKDPGETLCRWLPVVISLYISHTVEEAISVTERQPLQEDSADTGHSAHRNSRPLPRSTR